MPTLYTIHLSKHTRGMVKGPVKAIPAVYAGHLCKDTNYIVKPDPEAIRECLPAYYRKAFDRTGGSFWFSSRGNNCPASLELRGSRGQYLNTIYAQPYTFSPN
jgi:hypothetical protein